MTKKSKTTLAKTNPRFSYRTPKKDKENIEGRIKLLLEKINRNKGYFHITQNTIFLEAVYRGLEYLEKSKLTPEDAYFQIEFLEKDT